jgi:hypothetical protein
MLRESMLERRGRFVIHEVDEGGKNESECLQQNFKKARHYSITKSTVTHKDISEMSHLNLYPQEEGSFNSFVFNIETNKWQNSDQIWDSFSKSKLLQEMKNCEVIFDYQLICKKELFCEEEDSNQLKRGENEDYVCYYSNNSEDEAEFIYSKENNMNKKVISEEYEGISCYLISSNSKEEESLFNSTFNDTPNKISFAPSGMNKFQILHNDLLISNQNTNNNHNKLLKEGNNKDRQRSSSCNYIKCEKIEKSNKIGLNPFKKAHKKAKKETQNNFSNLIENHFFIEILPHQVERTSFKINSPHTFEIIKTLPEREICDLSNGIKNVSKLNANNSKGELKCSNFSINCLCYCHNK